MNYEDLDLALTAIVRFLSLVFIESYLGLYLVRWICMTFHIATLCTKNVLNETKFLVKWSTFSTRNKLRSTTAYPMAETYSEFNHSREPHHKRITVPILIWLWTSKYHHLIQLLCICAIFISNNCKSNTTVSKLL